jgi:hypothetical protein
LHNLLRKLFSVKLPFIFSLFIIFIFVNWVIFQKAFDNGLNLSNVFANFDKNHLFTDVVEAIGKFFVGFFKLVRIFQCFLFLFLQFLFHPHFFQSFFIKITYWLKKTSGFQIFEPAFNVRLNWFLFHNLVNSIGYFAGNNTLGTGLFCKFQALASGFFIKIFLFDYFAASIKKGLISKFRRFSLDHFQYNFWVYHCANSILSLLLIIQIFN